MEPTRLDGHPTVQCEANFSTPNLYEVGNLAVKNYLVTFSGDLPRCTFTIHETGDLIAQRSRASRLFIA